MWRFRHSPKGAIMRIRPKIAVTFAAALAASTSAGAATLNLSVTADNAFSVYLSTNNSVLGTLVGSNLYGPAGQWETSFSYTPALTNPIEYLRSAERRARTE